MSQIMIVLPHEPHVAGAGHLLHLRFAISPHLLITSLTNMFTLSRSRRAAEWGERTGSWLRLNGQLFQAATTPKKEKKKKEKLLKPAPHFLFPVRSYGYVMHLHTSDVSAAADLAVAL